MPVIHVDDLDAATEALADAPSPVVVVPVFNGYADVIRCYESLFRHTPDETTVLVVDDGGSDRRPITILDEMADSIRQTVVLYHRGQNGGFTRSCNDAFAATPLRDVIVVNSDVVVGSEWLTRLTDAANSSSSIATASTLTNHGTMVSVPERNCPDRRMPHGMSPDEVARRIAANSLRLRPTLPTAIGHCMYIKRTALDVVGGFDEEFGTGYAEEVDFSQRAVMLGFRHVCADDVFTYHRGAASFGDSALPQKERNEALLNVRYPWFPHWASRTENDPFSPLALAIDRARLALSEPVVGIDATAIGQQPREIQAVIVETITALADSAGIQRVTVYHTDAMPRSLRSTLDDIPSIERVSIRRDVGHRQTCDVIYRPCPVTSLDELRWLRAHGRRVVMNHVEPVAWSNPSYFASDAAWLRYRDLTRLVLATVDGVAFTSDFARREAAADGLVAEGTPTRVVYNGMTSALAHPGEERRPDAFPDVEQPFLLVLDSSCNDTNRPFSVELLAELRRRGWEGRLVLSGPTTAHGHSLGAEAEARVRSSGSAASVVTLGDLTDDEKRWLCRRAALGLYPTWSGDLGLVPFEMARHGVAVLTSRQGCLDELLPRDLISLTTFDVGAAADLAGRLLDDPSTCRAICDRLNERASTFTWNRTAAGILGLVDEVLRRAPNRTAALWGETTPIVLDHHAHLGNPRTYWSERVERTLQRMLRAEAPKRVAIPIDSRRQAIARRAANWARRKSGA